MHVCPVCGFPSLREAPRAPSGGGSYEICPSCGFQFGVDDDDRGLTYEQARERWVEQGMPWRSRGKAAPKGWSPRTQLASLSQDPPRSRPKPPAAKKSSSSKASSRASSSRKTPRK